METGATMEEPKKQNADVTLISNNILDSDNYTYYMSQRGVMMVVSDDLSHHTCTKWDGASP